MNKRALIALLILWGPSFSRAGEIVKKDGSVIYGQIVEENDKEVVIAASRKGMSMRMAIYRTEIASIDKNAAEPAAAPAVERTKAAATAKGEPVAPPIIKHSGPVYYRIPLRGTVGRTFVASILEKALDDAATRSPTVVVLEIDSSGGSIAEVPGLIDIITRHNKSLRIVVCVKSAMSAAAITALCVEDIYMQKGATIGAAVAFKLTPAGTPANINEKMQSAWRARCRSAAEMGKHSPLLADGMTDSSTSIYLRTTDGRPSLSSKPEPGSQRFKEPGKVLAMTASEAVRCGLARGEVADFDDLGKVMGFTKWTECKGTGEAWVEWLEKRLEVGSKEWKVVESQFDKAMSVATANDPGPYEYAGTDADSVKTWNVRSNLCADALKNAEGELWRLMRLASDYPELAAEPIYLDSEAISHIRNNISDIRRRVEAGRLRVPEKPAPKREPEHHPIIGG